jgi:thiamine biosynthesis protein ThiS
MGPEIEILLNGEKTVIPSSCNVEELIRRLELKRDQIAVEVNRRILKRDAWKSNSLKAGDSVEIVHFVGGGNDR